MPLKYACDSTPTGYSVSALDCADPIYLIYQFFVSPNPTRHAETQHCLRKNLANPHIHRIILLNERIYTNDELGLDETSPKLIQHNIGNRMLYSDVFRHCHKVYTGYWVVINSDIFFDDTLATLRKTDMHKTRKMWALMRWNLPDTYCPDINEILPTVLDTPSGDTQDCWIFHTNHSVHPRALGLLDFGFGVPGCDNKMVYVAHVLGFDVINAPNTVRAYHYHTSNHRNYTNANRIPPPYGIVYPENYDATQCPYFSKIEPRGYADHEAFWKYLQNTSRFIVLQPDADVSKMCFAVSRYAHAKRILAGEIAGEQVVTPDELRTMATELFEQNAQLKSRGIVLKNTQDMREYCDNYLHTISRATCILKPNKWSPEYNHGVYIHDAMFSYPENYPVFWDGVLEPYHYMYGRVGNWMNVLDGKRVLILCDRADECQRALPKAHTLFGGKGVFPPNATFIFKTISNDVAEVADVLNTWIPQCDIVLVASGTQGNSLCVSIYDMGRNAINVGKMLYWYFGLWNKDEMMYERPDIFRLVYTP